MTWLITIYIVAAIIGCVVFVIAAIAGIVAKDGCAPLIGALISGAFFIAIVYFAHYYFVLHHLLQ